jgi:hypothetical protein
VYAACKALAPKLNVGVKTLRKWVAQAQVDAGDRSGPTSEELEEIRHGLRRPALGPGGHHGGIPRHRQASLRRRRQLRYRYRSGRAGRRLPAKHRLDP